MTRLLTLVRSIRDIWLILGVALLMLAVIEIGLTVAFATRNLWHPPVANFRSEADTYADREWAARYYAELDAFEHSHVMRWRPYVYWRRPPYHGTSINVTADGLRATTSLPPVDPTVKFEKVFMFGGSTMWGLGAADNATIPSLVAKAINKPDRRCEVVNFGQYAYVSTQGVIELVLQLQRGHVPDIVIFMDGVNDTFGAFQLGVPGYPYEEFMREQAFNFSLANLAATTVSRAARPLSITRAVNGALARAGLRTEHVRSVPLRYEPPLSDRTALAHAVVETYLTNVRVVRALAESYGFTALFYWQPVIYLKPHLTEYERRSIEREANYPGMKEFYLETYAIFGQRTASINGNATLHDISAIFHDVSDPIFVDFNHMGERGNAAIANRITRDVIHALEARSLLRRDHGFGFGETSGTDLFDLPAVERR